MATFAMMGLTALSTGMAVAGHIREGEASAAAAEANAQAADRYAQMSRDEYGKKVAMEQFKNKLALGSIRSAYGASGVTMEGTPQEYMDQSAAAAKTNELNLQYEGVLKAQAYGIQARNYRQGGQYAQSGANISAFAAGAAGLSNAIGQIYGDRSSGRSSLYS